MRILAMLAARPVKGVATQRDIDRLRSRLVEQESGCWVYTGVCRRSGYGQFKIKGKIYLAHRVAYFGETGVDPGELGVLHRCDNPPCCRPDHLFLGTAADNNRDCIAKGRNNIGDRHGMHRHPERAASGERNGLRTHPERNPHFLYPELRERISGEGNPAAKLTAAQAAEIRLRSQRGEAQLTLAAEYGVSPAAVSAIKRGKTWQRVA